MDVGLGMHPYTRDDKDIGTVDGLVLDPPTGAVRAIVIRRGTILAHDVEAPMDALEVGMDGNVRLAYTADQIDALPAFDAGQFLPPPTAFVPPPGFPSGALNWPIDATERASAAVTPDTAPAPEPPERRGGSDRAVEGGERAARRPQQAADAVIREGSDVISRDGVSVGSVHRLSYDPDSGALRHFVVREGMLFTRGVELPAALIASADDDVVQLAVDADDLRRRLTV